MYNLTQVLNSIQRGFIFIKWKQSEVVEVLNLIRGGILFLIETSGLFKPDHSPRPQWFMKCASHCSIEEPVP